MGKEAGNGATPAQQRAPGTGCATRSRVSGYVYGRTNVRRRGGCLGTQGSQAGSGGTRGDEAPCSGGRASPSFASNPAPRSAASDSAAAGFVRAAGPCQAPALNPGGCLGARYWYCLPSSPSISPGRPSIAALWAKPRHACGAAGEPAPVSRGAPRCPPSLPAATLGPPAASRFARIHRIWQKKNKERKGDTSCIRKIDNQTSSAPARGLRGRRRGAGLGMEGWEVSTGRAGGEMPH